AGWVEALELALAVDAGDAQVQYRLRGFGRHLATQIDELAVRALGQAALQLVRIHAQRARQIRDALVVVQHLGGIGPDRGHRRRHRQRLAIAVEDGAARDRDRHLAQEARVALALVELLAYHL